VLSPPFCTSSPPLEEQWRISGSFHNDDDETPFSGDALFPLDLKFKIQNF
jgi:hypothetical protein